MHISGVREALKWSHHISPSSMEEENTFLLLARKKRVSLRCSGEDLLKAACGSAPCI